MYWISIVLIFRSEGAWSAKDALCKTTFAAQSVKKATFSTYPTMSAFSRIAIAEVEISERGGRPSIASSEHRDRATEFTRDLGFDFIGEPECLRTISTKMGASRIAHSRSCVVGCGFRQGIHARFSLPWTEPSPKVTLGVKSAAGGKPLRVLTVTVGLYRKSSPFLA